MPRGDTEHTENRTRPRKTARLGGFGDEVGRGQEMSVGDKSLIVSGIKKLAPGEMGGPISIIACASNT